jgi:hypothetical protein
VYTFLDGIAVALIASLAAAVWFMWRSDFFETDKED